MTTSWGKPQADEWPCTLHSFRRLDPQSSISGLCLPGRIGAWKTEKYIDMMPWAFPPACSLAKKSPVFTFRSIRAINSSENTVIVAVVKRYVQLRNLLLSACSLSFHVAHGWEQIRIKSLTQQRSVGPEPVTCCNPLMFFKLLSC